ncbi:MAG: hypothetical protein RR515_01135 [Clostridium sp.]
MGPGMVPLYDKKANFVGWLVDSSNVFNEDLEWVAYVYYNYVWSVKTGRWIGQLRGTNLLDRDGRIVAWSTSGPVVGGLGLVEGPINIGPASIPVPPIISEVPLHPDQAPEPAGEWSKLTFDQWLNQR